MSRAVVMLLCELSEWEYMLLRQRREAKGSIIEEDEGKICYRGQCFGAA